MNKESNSKLRSYLTVPNFITSIRIIGSIVMLFLDAGSLPFFIVYGACGVSDAVDGFVARRLHQTTSFGRKLDSASDLIFYCAMAYKVFIPLVTALKTPVLCIVVALLVIRVILYLIAGFKYKVFISSHSLFNKATGFVVFLIPYMLKVEESVNGFFFYYSIIGCVVATLAVTYDINHSVKKIITSKAADQTKDGGK